MPHISEEKDLREFIAKLPFGSFDRLLFLSDLKTNTSGYCMFTSPRFGEVEHDAVEGLFEESLEKLNHPFNVYFSPQELPILNSVGPFQITLIERSTDGKVTIIDPTGQSVQSHIAVGD